MAHVFTFTLPRKALKAHRTQDNGSTLESLYRDLFDRLQAAAEELNGKTLDDDFNPSDHPHAPAGNSKGGQFVSKAGGGGSAGEKPTTITGKSAKAGMHQLFSSGHPFSKSELMTICGIKSEKLFSDYMAMIKNPKYAGPAGALTIKKLPNGSFQVVTPDGKPAPPPPAMPDLKKAETVEPKVTETKTPVAPAKALLSTKGMTPQQMDKAFQKHSVADIQTHFQEKFGLNIIDGFDNARKKKLDADYAAAKLVLRQPEGMATVAEREAALAITEAYHPQRRAHLAGEAAHPAGYLRGHNHVNLDSGTAAAKQQRKIMAHIDAAFEHLQESGYDIKAALSKANVAYVAGNPKSAKGHAWIKDGVGHFSISGSKNTDLANHTKQMGMAERRVSSGRPVWSRSGRPGIDIKESARSTIIHEFAHALGMQKQNNSPEKLGKILEAMNAAGQFPAPQPDGSNRIVWQGARIVWLQKNISEYAASNIKETDAELASMVTAPDYKPGTLPKELEQHVYGLFNKKG